MKKEKKIRYRIYKFVDGNGNTWYQVKRKLFLFIWEGVKYCDPYGLTWERRYSIEEAEQLCSEDAELIKHKLKRSQISIEIVREFEL